jgi:hypothetical protein
MFALVQVTSYGRSFGFIVFGILSQLNSSQWVDCTYKKKRKSVDTVKDAQLIRLILQKNLPHLPTPTTTTSISICTSGDEFCGIKKSLL